MNFFFFKKTSNLTFLTQIILFNYLLSKDTYSLLYFFHYIKRRELTMFISLNTHIYDLTPKSMALPTNMSR